MRGRCRKCSAIAPLSPDGGVCRECIARTLAEDPRSAAHLAAAANILDAFGIGDFARELGAVHVLARVPRPVPLMSGVRVIARLIDNAIAALARGDDFAAGHMVARAEAYADLEPEDIGERGRQLADAVHTIHYHGGPFLHVSTAHGVLVLVYYLERCRK